MSCAESATGSVLYFIVLLMTRGRHSSMEWTECNKADNNLGFVAANCRYALFSAAIS